MWQEIHWHPMIVHFPLALVLTAAAAFICARSAPRGSLSADLAVVGSWTLVLAAVTAVVAVATGLGAAMNLTASPAASHSIALHLYAAAGSTLLIIALAIWRGAGRKGSELPHMPFILVLSLASAGFIVAGYFGGENVYHYGIGVLGH